jgi:hypothetical protein
LSISLVVIYGVPQRSGLDSLFFILYVNDVLHLTQGRTIMCADDTSILNMEQDKNELQITTSVNTGLVVHYFEGNTLSINPAHYILLVFQMKPCRLTN